jgi:hypothetical protein
MQDVGCRYKQNKLMHKREARRGEERRGQENRSKESSFLQLKWFSSGYEDLRKKSREEERASDRKQELERALSHEADMGIRYIGRRRR